MAEGGKNKSKRRADEEKSELTENDVLAKAPRLGDIQTASKSGDEYTTLMHASEEGNLDMIKLLLKNEADINKGNSKWNPLLLAAHHGHKHIAKALLKAGADVNWFSSHGYTALMHASKNHQPELVSLLLEFKPDVNILSHWGESALYFAANVGDENVIRELLDHNASVRPQDYSVKSGEKQIKYKITDYLKHNSAVRDKSARLLYAAGAKRIENSKIPQVVRPWQNLKSRCREVIRDLLLSPARGDHNNLLIGVPKLALPKKILEYLLYQEFELAATTTSTCTDHVSESAATTSAATDHVSATTSTPTATFLRDPVPSSPREIPPASRSPVICPNPSW